MEAFQRNAGKQSEYEDLKATASPNTCTNLSERFKFDYFKREKLNDAFCFGLGIGRPAVDNFTLGNDAVVDRRGGVEGQANGRTSKSGEEIDHSCCIIIRSIYLCKIDNLNTRPN